MILIKIKYLGHVCVNRHEWERKRARAVSGVVVATRDYEEFHRTTDTPTFSSCNEIKNSRFSCCLNNYILQLEGSTGKENRWHYSLRVELLHEKCWKIENSQANLHNNLKHCRLDLFLGCFSQLIIKLQPHQQKLSRLTSALQTFSSKERQKYLWDFSSWIHKRDSETSTFQSSLLSAKFTSRFNSNELNKKGLLCERR